MENLLNCFSNFKCKMGECKKSCCTLWQIDVDKKTLSKYKKVKGEFATRISDGVDFNSSSLRVKEGRCTFLNEEGLCDIIINLGKDYLGEICTVHPRFNSSLKGYTETGIGLACEEGARLLLEFNGKIFPTTPPNIAKLKGFEKDIVLYRNNLLDILYSSLPLKDKLIQILSAVGLKEVDFLFCPYATHLNEAEVLDARWKERLKHFSSLSLEIDKKVEKEMINLLAYFIYRHIINAVDNLDLNARTLFSLFSALAIHNIYINEKKVQKDLSLLIEIARDYSAEIEYSENNLFSLLDLFEELTIKTQLK